MGLFDKKKTDVEIAENAIEIQLGASKAIEAHVNKETIMKFMKGTGLTTQLTDVEAEMFVDMATMHQLNPFKREIHCAAYGEKGTKWRTLSIVTGYEVYLAKAQNSGLLESWRVEECDPSTPIGSYWCTLYVKRRDQKKEQSWRTYYAEVFQTKKDGTPNAFWKKQPRFMTRKVCMGQGFRLFFEDVLHGIPYIREEEFGHIEAEPEVQRPKAVEKVDTVVQTIESVLPENPFPEEPKRAEPAESTFVQIMNIINGGKVPNEKKVGIMVEARGTKENEEGLKALLAKIKEEYNL